MHALLRAMMVALFAAATIPAQCANNLVTNGDFTNVLPIWSKVGPVSLTFPSANVNAVGSSRCASLTNATGAFVLNAPGTMNLPAGDYEFSMDVLWSGWGTTFGFDLVTAGAPTTIGSATLPLTNGGGRVRIAFLFSMQTGGTHSLAINVTTSQSVSVIQIDNVTIHPAQLPYFNFDQIARQTGLNSWSVTAMPNDLVAVAVGLGLQAVPLPIPTCSGTLQISDPGVVIQLAAVSPSGVLNGPPLFVPAVVAGLPLYWQAVGFMPTSSCYLGCGDMIAF